MLDLNLYFLPALGFDSSDFVLGFGVDSEDEGEEEKRKEERRRERTISVCMHKKDKRTEQKRRGEASELSGRDLTSMDADYLLISNCANLKPLRVVTTRKYMKTCKVSNAQFERITLVRTCTPVPLPRTSS